MEKLSFNVDGVCCYECSRALQSFLTSLHGIISVEVENGRVVIGYDPEEISADMVERVARDSIERIGYRIRD